MRYLVYDVFTDRPLAGNPLAVVPDADDLDAATMAALAREFNLSETAFLLASETCDARARYFTPAAELPTAGHPTVGSAFALERLGRLPAGDAATLELGVGPTPLRLEREEGELRRVWMDQGVPERLAGLELGAAARLLGLEPVDLVGPAEVWSVGNPFVVVPLRDLDALARAALDPAVARELLPEDGSEGGFRAALPFTLATHLAPGAPDLRCRMFGAGLGVPEDPATGSAHGPLGGYLAAHDLVDVPAEGATLVSHQGVEMGRPSELHVRLERRGDAVAALVGGRAVLVAEGTLHL